MTKNVFLEKYPAEQLLNKFIELCGFSELELKEHTFLEAYNTFCSEKRKLLCILKPQVDDLTQIANIVESAKFYPKIFDQKYLINSEIPLSSFFG